MALTAYTNPPQILQIWRYDNTGSVWTLEAGNNPLVSVGGRGLLCFYNAYKGDYTTTSLPADTAGIFTNFANTTIDPSVTGLNPITSRMAYQLNPLSGNHTITPPSPLGAGDIGLMFIVEDGTLPSSSLVQTSGNYFLDNSSGTSWSVSTANGTPAALDRVYTLGTIISSPTTAIENLTNPPGFYSLAVRQNGATNLPVQLSYKDNASAGALTAIFKATVDPNITSHGASIASFTRATYTGGKVSKVTTFKTPATPTALTYAVPLPSPLVVGSIVLVGVATIIAATVTLPAGWAKNVEITDGFSSFNFAYFTRVIDGTEGATVLATASTSQSINGFSCEILGCSGVVQTFTNSGTTGNTLVGPVVKNTSTDVLVIYSGVTNDSVDTLPNSLTGPTTNLYLVPGASSSDASFIGNYVVYGDAKLQATNSFVSSNGNNRAWVTIGVAFAIVPAVGTAVPSTGNQRPRGSFYTRGGALNMQPTTGINARGMFSYLVNANAVWGQASAAIIPNTNKPNPIFFAGRF